MYKIKNDLLIDDIKNGYSESPLTDKEKFKKAFNNIYENLAIIYTICKKEDKKDLNAINDQLFNVLTSQLNNISNRE